MTMISKAGIYIHIPFCVRKCIYCDFVSFAGCGPEQIYEYFDALMTECRLLVSEPATLDAKENQLLEYTAAVLPADSLFIGGGTPSAVNAEYITELMQLLPLTEDAERTIEANPGTLDSDKLRKYRDCGINRLSLGVQSFQDSELSFLGRIHNREEAIASFREARAAGFDNISMDLMFGFPGQTIASWRKTLETAVELEPEHLSFYSLQIEEGTLLYRMFREGIVEQIPDELNRDMYHYAVQFLKENGYMRYEISNAARSGKECRHNLKYWTMAPYFGLGAASHSFVRDVRYAAPGSIKDYLRLIENIAQSGSYFKSRGSALQVNNPDDTLSDYLFTGLRLIQGIDLRDFEKNFGVPFQEKFGKVLDRHLRDGTMVLKDHHVKFTEKGIDLSNNVLMDFI